MTMLATKTMMASPAEPVSHRWTTPLMIVSVRVPPKRLPVCRMGRMLAGM
jgi:hypothetical protein